MSDINNANKGFPGIVPGSEFHSSGRISRRAGGVSVYTRHVPVAS